MKKQHVGQQTRQGVTLMEVMLAVSISAAMMTSSFVVLRSSFAAWRAHEIDMDRSEQATTLLRHLVRHVRQSAGVSAVSADGDLSGFLTLVNADGSTLTWEHSGTSVTLSLDGGAAQPLSNDIQALEFEPLKADCDTPALEPFEVMALRMRATSATPTGGTRETTSHAWVRSW